MKTIFDLTVQEIESLPSGDIAAHRAVLSETISEMRYEIERLENITSDFGQRSGSLLTLSGLLAFIPGIGGFGIQYLEHFLLWTFPLLLAAIFSIYFSQQRTQFILRQFATDVPGSHAELIHFRNRAVAVNQHWRTCFDSYYKVMPIYRLSTIFVYLYVLSFTINIMIFVILGTPGSFSGAVLLVSLVALGLAELSRLEQKSKTVNILR